MLISPMQCDVDVDVAFKLGSYIHLQLNRVRRVCELDSLICLDTCFTPAACRTRLRFREMAGQSNTQPIGGKISEW